MGSGGPRTMASRTESVRPGQQRSVDHRCAPVPVARRSATPCRSSALALTPPTESPIEGVTAAGLGRAGSSVAFGSTAPLSGEPRSSRSAARIGRVARDVAGVTAVASRTRGVQIRHCGRSRDHHSTRIADTSGPRQPRRPRRNWPTPGSPDTTSTGPTPGSTPPSTPVPDRQTADGCARPQHPRIARSTAPIAAARHGPPCPPPATDRPYSCPRRAVAPVRRSHRYVRTDRLAEHTRAELALRHTGVCRFPA